MFLKEVNLRMHLLLASWSITIAVHRLKQVLKRSLTLISVFEIGKVIHSGAMLARWRDTDIKLLLALALEIPMVSPINLRKLPEA